MSYTCNWGEKVSKERRSKQKMVIKDDDKWDGIGIKGKWSRTHTKKENGKRTNHKMKRLRNRHNAIRTFMKREWLQG